MDSTTAMVHLSGHDIVVLRMAIDSEIEVWRKLIKVDAVRRPGDLRSTQPAHNCLRDLQRLAGILDQALEGLGVGMEANGLPLGSCKGEEEA